MEFFGIGLQVQVPRTTSNMAYKCKAYTTTSEKRGKEYWQMFYQLVATAGLFVADHALKVTHICPTFGAAHL
jgi:hypothetical protein